MCTRLLELMLCLALVTLGCTSPPATTATPAPVGPAPVSAAPAPPAREARRALIDSISATLRERYIDPDVAERMIESLHEHWERGKYDTADDAALAKLVRADLQAVSHDEHVGLYFGAGGASARGPRPRTSRGPGGDRRFGFGPSQRLSGNVALLPIFNLVPADEDAAQQAIADYMSQVADAAALIIDLRDNNGGRAPTLALVVTYLLDGPPVLLARVDRRYDGASYELWTRADVKGKRFGGTKPLYLLTSARTFSGGEGLARHLQALGRAKVVGESTRGGAYLREMFELGGEFRLGVSVAQMISPSTPGRRKNGVGVIPDVSVPADRALEEAHRRALEELARSFGASAG